MMLNRIVVVALVTMLSALPISAQNILNVPADYGDIQTAIANANNGDIVMVGPGTYTGANNRDIELFGKSITVRSSDGPSVTTINCGFQGRGFYIHHGESRSTVIAGFTIQSGLGQTGPGGATYGGAMMIEESSGGLPTSPTIRNCEIRQSSAGFGGGAYVEGDSDPLFDSCVFYGNEGTVLGGALFLEQHAQVWNSRFEENSAGIGGGAVRAGAGQTSYFLNCRFVANYAELGGACYLSGNGSNQIFRNCLFKGNFTLSDSPADDHGGAVYGGTGATCLFCTFVGNDATGLGHTAYENSTAMGFLYSILWDSPTNSVVNPSILNYVDIREAALADPAQGSFSEEPLFVAGPGPDGSYYLSPPSQCVDAGNLQSSAACNIGGGPGSCQNDAATRADLYPDTGVLDIGFHYFHPVFYGGFETGDSSQWTFR